MHHLPAYVAHCVELFWISKDIVGQYDQENDKENKLGRRGNFGRKI